MESQLQLSVIDTLLVGLHASLAGVSFAGLVFLLRWGPSTGNVPPDVQILRQHALLSLTTTVFLFFIGAAQYILAAGYQRVPVLAWILTATTAPATVCGPVLLYFTVILLLRAHDFDYATRYVRTLFTFAWIAHGAYLWIDLSAATAAVVFGSVPIVRMPVWLVALSLGAVAVPMGAAILAPRSSRVRERVARTEAFEQLLTFIVVLALGSPVIALAVFALGATAIDPRLWIFLSLVGMVAVSTALALTRLVLFAHLDRLGSRGLAST